mmetsp:Transcript_6046/g.37480  ORF Transcript_6046/g.37480 Transcript_6046/m.37480 type:complete len:265 (+) Transcript_6046:328-1122(+)|eukprot:CAMPEP_0183824196 /NCGR_PEP_ID=MMETSP0807_2-20130328/448_1 /TAXON_ID=88271 /ORGANISM="Picocystis salinarum, Strain CCMP1897" /LENGTH=264 /DNA_ID=CAMNT_0026069109 /DNA_START=252 /DNA_END=1046 /DNA_ORIENTATION=+
MTTKSIKRVAWRDQHDAASILAEAFQEDPLFIRAFRNPRARFVAVYTVAASQMASGTGSADVLMDDTTCAFESVIMWEKTKDDCRFGYIEMGLRTLIMAFSNYYYMIKGAAYHVGFSKQIGGLLNALLVILYGVCTLWVIRFFLEFLRMGFVYGYIVIKGDGFISQYEKEFGKLGKRRKHLLMIGTLSAVRGQSIGSKLMKHSLDIVDKSNLYDYYYLESSNTRNIPFYERHGFVKIGEAVVVGKTVTYMIRKKPPNMDDQQTT